MGIVSSIFKVVAEVFLYIFCINFNSQFLSHTGLQVQFDPLKFSLKMGAVEIGLASTKMVD